MRRSLNEVNGLAWTTISKMRGMMQRIYKVGILHEHVSVETAMRYVESEHNKLANPTPKKNAEDTVCPTCETKIAR